VSDSVAHASQCLPLSLLSLMSYVATEHQYTLCE